MQVAQAHEQIASQHNSGNLMKILDFFQKAYVINLPERSDRRKDVETELKKNGMQFAPGKLELFPGVRPTEAAGFPGIGARGCFLSHLQILEQARSEGLSNVLIIEDDLLIGTKFKEHEETLIEQLKHQEWDLAYLGYITHQPIVLPVEFVSTQDPIRTTHCYAVNAKIFDRLIDFLHALQHRSPGDPNGGPMHLDGAYNFFRQQNPDVLTLRPNCELIAQRSSRSDVAAQAWFDQVPIIRSLVNLLRNGKTFLRSQSDTLN